MIANTKYIFVTGGVVSSLGKGLASAAIGALLESRGLTITIQKLDPYINVDPGTMNPFQHGEVFVTDDGAETDLDLGHYERLLDIHLTKESSVSSGQIFEEILKGERDGKFLGKNIQLVPNVVDAVKARLLKFALKNKVDFVLVEIGGTVGDMEGISFLEAIRQLKMDLESNRIMLCHLSLVPFLGWSKELKTKPTQHSVMLLQKAGLAPDSIFLRSDKVAIEAEHRDKISVICAVDKSLIFNVRTCDPIYKLFISLQKQKVNERIQDWFVIKNIKKSNLSRWQNLINKIVKSKKELNIALVAKYTGGNDPYLSVIRALEAACYDLKYKVNIKIIDASKLENKDANLKEIFNGVKGIVVPGGFDYRGIEGKIKAAKYARENTIPFLGLCLGMQVMLIEFARSVLEFRGANSAEVNPNAKYPIIYLLEEQKGVSKKGGTMRLGVYACSIIPDTVAYKAYKKNVVSERHRHRYEFNNDYKKRFEKAGVVFSGIYKKDNLVEIAEIKDHPFMLGCQFHPEFLSSPLKPHPLFKEFLKKTIK